MAKKHEKRMNNMEKELQIWDREHYPVMDKDGRAYIPEEGERFVPLFNYLKKDKHGNPAPKIDYRYRVSEKGEVFSFTKTAASKTGRPLWLTKNLSGSKGYEYYVVSDKWRVHELVWFSFAADAILSGTELPRHYNVMIDSYEDLVSLCKQESLEVHHIFRNRLDNRLGGLMFIDRMTHRSILHKLAGMPDEDRAAFINENLMNGAIIFTGEAYRIDDPETPIKDNKYGLSIEKLEDASKSLTPIMRSQINAVAIHAIVWEQVAMVYKQSGDAFFVEDRFIYFEVGKKFWTFKVHKVEDGLLTITSFNIGKYETCTFDIVIQLEKMKNVG